MCNKMQNTGTTPIQGEDQDQYSASKASSPLSNQSSQSGGSHSPLRYCPLCLEVGLLIHISRTADLKRHLESLHRGNTIWICPKLDCGMMFEWEAHFKAHQKTHHQGQGVGRAEAPTKIELLPRLVFACGFSHCKFFLKAETHHDSISKTELFFFHILHHFKENINLDWHYSVRVRNLMRQGGVNEVWKARNKCAEEFQWQPHNSFVLRKLLEACYFVESTLPSLVKYAVMSRSPPYCYPNSPIPELPAALSAPPLPRLADYANDSSSFSLLGTVASHHDSVMQQKESFWATTSMTDSGLGDSWMLLDDQEHFYLPAVTTQTSSLEFPTLDPALPTMVNQSSTSVIGYYYHDSTGTSGSATYGQSLDSFPNIFSPTPLSYYITPPELEQQAQQESGFTVAFSEVFNNDSMPDTNLHPQTDE
ncbi:hypothetical protein V8F33_003203 [Rhypophila sp. PSN 637]